MYEREMNGGGERTPERVNLNRDVLIPEMSFLAENPEAFGLVADACPLATKHLLIAANGCPAEGGGSIPSCEPESGGVDGLFEFYGDLLRRDVETETALQYAFGKNNMAREHPISRYCAVLAEVTALRVLGDQEEELGYAETLAQLNDELGWALHAFRQRIESKGEVEVTRDTAFEPTVGICRIREMGGGDYVVDVFAAGDFRVYLLDERGMAPLWTSATQALSPERNVGLTGKSMKFRHPSPFAVLLVSDSICALNAAEYRSLRNNPGLAWRYRMRLEDYFLRVLTDCVREHEFGDRAGRFFVGRSHGRDSASGALTVMKNVSYETFHLSCQNRLSSLGRQMELLPDGYDPKNLSPQMPREEAERRYLQRLLELSADLNDRLTNALRIQILKKYRQEEEGEPLPPPAEVPCYVRLNPDEISGAVRRLDRENREDRARIAENHKILREIFSEHWITLRPKLTAPNPKEEGCDGAVEVRPDGQAVGQPAGQPTGQVDHQIFETCEIMNRRLAEMKARRKGMMEEIKSLMAECLEVAEAESGDWVSGRAGWDSVAAWMEPLREELPARLARVEAEWQEDTERFRGLLTAYTAQREDLFHRDIAPKTGIFASQWEAILEGSLPDTEWERWRADLLEDPKTARFGELLDALRRVSAGTGVLLSRIRARAVENRAARELANQSALRIAALRGAAYEDADWGEEILAVMDSATRNAFHAAVSNWEHEKRRREQQKEAYEAYSAMYHAFGS